MLRKLEKYFQWHGLPDSSELASETMFRVYKKIQEGADVPEDKLPAYLFGVARLVKHEAHARSRRHDGGGGGDGRLVGSDQSPDLGILIEELLNQLSESDRKLLEMAVWNSTEKIARKLGTSKGSITVRLSKIRKKMREAAGRQGNRRPEA
jgi:DNA-directed RNA polymerase specialized sigma24 family protein